MRSLLLWLFTGIVLAGCAAGGGAGTSSIPVSKGAPIVYIHPLSETYARASLGVPPFQMPAGVGAEQGSRVAALFKDVLLGNRSFPVIRQLADPYGDLDEALEIGRRAGVDLVLAGRVGSVLGGTELGGARVSVALRLLDTATGQTVWYVEQAAEQPMAHPDLGLASRLRSSFSPSPIRQVPGAPAATSMLVQIASDFAAVLQGAQTVGR